MNIFRFDSFTVLYESVKDAKQYLIKKEEEKVGKNLSKETEDRVINDPSFKKILKMTEKNPGYTYPFTRLYFNDWGEKVSFIDLAEVYDWATSLQTKHLVNKLPMSIMDFSNSRKKLPEELSTYEDQRFEKLRDEIEKIKLEEKSKWLINLFPSNLKKSYKESSDEEKKNFYNLVKKWAEVFPGIEKNHSEDKDSHSAGFIKQISTFKNFKELLEKLVELIKSFVNKSETESKIQKHFDEDMGALAVESENNILPIFILDVQAQKGICSLGNWCINTGSWSSYINKNTVQLNIFNFNEPLGSKYYLVGMTVDKQGNVTHNSDINNQAITQFNKPLNNNLNVLGYPESLKKKIIDSLPLAFIIKDIKESLTSTDSIKNFIASLRKNYNDSLINQFFVYVLDSNTKKDDYIKKYESAFEKGREVILKKIEDNIDNFIEYYINKGIIENVDILFYRNILSNKISEEQKQKIKEKTLSALRVIKNAVIQLSDRSYLTSNEKDKFKQVLELEDEILDTLKV